MIAFPYLIIKDVKGFYLGIFYMKKKTWGKLVMPKTDPPQNAGERFTFQKKLEYRTLALSRVTVKGLHSNGG